jgi:hypothetical protein
MANTIRIKRKSTTGAPTAGQLVEGELAINTFDQKLYSKDATTVFEIGAGSGSSDTWVMKTATYTLVAGDKINVTATSGTATIEPPATLVAGDSFQVHNDTTSTQTVQVNPQTGQTIRGAGSSVTAADNMILIPGDTAHFIAISTTVMEVV